MDFMVNRIQNIEKSLSNLENFCGELKKRDNISAAELNQLLEAHCAEEEFEHIHKNLDLLKKRIQNDEIVEKSDYQKLKQMKDQYEDLAEFLSQQKIG